ncbi:Crp/Fnr family transcriptional regulator [uncultured Pseudoflavonifractor sp.]|uniref:Crp/Fnr family transcriptional regulator n=1 Tax=uncultured Pseudoflavonifractor sp. TaxID=1221379 RepID=UPI0025DFFD68|nr:Crp/Fnr family transcriptional regulator [uncultured Pseudoflavonifractor sp.]
MLLIDFFQKALGISDETLVQEALRVSETRVLRKGEYLIRQGNVPAHVYFLMQGIVRGVLSDVNGKEITDCLVFKCGAPVMPSSDITQAAPIDIQTLSECEVVRIAVSEINRLLRTYPALEELYRQLIVESARTHWELKIAIYQYNAMERYQWFQQVYPGLSEKISNKYIASFLNMTPVTLSRLKQELKKQG